MIIIQTDAISYQSEYAAKEKISLEGGLARHKNLFSSNKQYLAIFAKGSVPMWSISVQAGRMWINCGNELNTCLKIASNILDITLHHEKKYIFLCSRGPLGTTSFARGRSKYRSTVRLYKSSQGHSQPIRYCLVHVWWCLVVSDACLVVSGDVNVYRLIWPELIDVYGQISLPVHVTDAAKMLMLLMRWCCWCNAAAEMLMLLNQDQDLLADLSIALCSSSGHPPCPLASDCFYLPPFFYVLK